jgi:membrane protease YdiL (CAAX protease family)
MSILPADISSTTAPVSPEPVSPGPTTAPAGSSEVFLLIFVLWAAIGIALAWALGVLRRGSVSGPDRLLVPRAAWDLLLVLCGAFFVANAGTLLVLHLMHSPAEAAVLSAGLLGNSASLVVLLVAVRQWKKFGVARLGLDASRAGAGIITGAAAIFILFPLIQLTSFVVDLIIHHLHLHSAQPHPLLQTLGTTHSRKVEVLAVILAVVMAPLQEELLFRGLLQTAMRRCFDWLAFESGSTLPQQTNDGSNPSRLRTLPRWAAICVTAMAFAAVHGEPAFLAPLFVLAVGLGYAYERTGNLWVTITAHATFNAVQISLFLAMPPSRVG